MTPLPLPAHGSPLWLLVTWLLVWRLTALLVYDRGPFDALTRVRAALARSGLAQLVTCFHCAAIWVSLIVVGLLFERRLASIALVGAIAGAASITERMLGGAAGPPAEGEVDA